MNYEMFLCVNNTFWKHLNVHTYTLALEQLYAIIVFVCVEIAAEALHLFLAPLNSITTSGTVPI